MAKPELGTKRMCASCGAKFYDLSKDPIICPKCGTVHQVMAPNARARAEPVVRAPVKVVPEVEVPEVAEAEFVSLEEADAEAAGGKKPKAAAADGEDEVEIEETLDDATFIEEQEEGDPDVTDIIGEREKDEET